MSIKIETADEEYSARWDELVTASPHGTIFHTWKWLKIMEKYSWMDLMKRHTKDQLYPLIGLKGSTPVGVFPLFYYRNLLIRCVFSPPLRTAVTYLGPVLADYDQLKQSKRESVFIEFQKHVDEFISSELKPNHIRFRTPPGLFDSRPFKWSGYQVEPSYNYLVDLSKGPDYVWGRFNKKLREDIRRTMNGGISVEEGSKSELEFIYKSVHDRYKEQCLKPETSKDYLLDLYDSFHPKNLRLFVAKHQGDLISGFIATCYKDKFSAWIGFPKSNLKGLYPNDLLQWEAIKWACEHGFRYYEIMWANTPRLRHYKSKYNPKLDLYFSINRFSPFISCLRSLKNVGHR